MNKSFMHTPVRILFVTLMALILQLGSPQPRAAEANGNAKAGARPAVPAPLNASIPIFRNPVVPGATISGYFDHSPANGAVTFYDGRHNNSSAYGFYFSCSNPSMYDFVGCEDNVNGVNACSPSRQLWYDNHHGTDYEYSSNWYTADVCDPGRFAGITHPVYAPARGKVSFAGYNPSRPANGWHIILKHDLNNDGNFENDNLRAFYLHFTANQLAVYTRQIVEDGQYLGLGGSTGYSSSPHLHFEVQRSSDNFSATAWPVDPYGWQGAFNDPWSYLNINFWQASAPPPSPTPSPSPTPTRPPVNYTDFAYLPQIIREDQPACQNCAALIRNSDFEAGHQVWVEQGVQVIAGGGDPNLHVQPHSGIWLAWMAGRNSANDTLSQDFTLPGDATRATLNYYLEMTTLETENIDYDRMVVFLRDSNGNVIQQLDSLGNTFKPSGQWIQRSIDIPNLSAWQGKTLRLSFESATDSNTLTSFYVDDVSFTASP